MTSGGDGGGGLGPEVAASRSTLLAVILPGLPQILGGRRGPGALVLLLWLGLWALVVIARERIVAAPSGGLDDGVALASLWAALAGAVAWSVRGVRRGGAAGRETAGEGLSPGSPRRRPLGAWQPVLRAFTDNRLAVAGAVTVVLLYLVALLTPFLAPADPAAQGALVAEGVLPPSPGHPLGTDQYARDVLSRLLYGARISLSVGFVAVAISVGLGSVVGAVAGYVGGRTDTLLMRTVDLVLSFPRLVLLIAVIAMLERPSIVVIMVVLGLTLWPHTARIVRGEVLALREREFVEAARALGFSDLRIVFRHLLPNALAAIIVAATLGMGHTIVLEAGLSFLGIGVQAPTPSWGSMVADGRDALLGAWWISTFPGFAIVFTVLAFNVVGDGLRDALDPRLRGGEGGR